MDVLNKNSKSSLQLIPFQYMPALLILLVGFFFLPTIELLYSRWIKWDEGLSHGLIIISAFFIFLTKSLPWNTSTNSKLSQACALALLAASSLFWLLSHLTNIFILEQLILIPIATLLLAATFGWQSTYRQKMLLGLLIFAIPIFDPINNSLVNLSSFMVGQMVQAINMPAVIDGNSIFIPFGHILIADGCSGIRYFVIALALGYIIAYLNNYPLHKILVTLAIAAFIGLLANWLRIFILVVIGYKTEMQSSLMGDHEYFGWALFAAISFPAIYFAPVIKTHREASQVHRFTLTQLLIPILVLSFGPIINLLFSPTIITKPLIDPIPFTHPIQHVQMPVEVLAPKFGRQDNGQFNNVFFQVNQYQQIEPKDKLVPYIGKLYENENYALDVNSKENIDGINVGLSIFRNKSTAKKTIQLQWFDLGGYTTSSLTIAKLLQIPAKLTGKNLFTIVTLQAVCDINSCDNARDRVFAAAHSLNIKHQGD